jgi:type IV secretory pathway VirB4 component
MLNRTKPVKNLKALNHIPYSDIVDSILLTWNEGFLAALKLTPKDIECSDKTDLNNIGRSLRRLLNEFSKDFSYKFISQGFSEIGKSEKNFTLWIELKKSNIRYKTFFLKSTKTLEVISSEGEGYLIQIKAEQQRILNACAQIGITAEILKKEGILSGLKSMFKPDQKYEISSLLALRKSDLLIKENNFFYGQSYWSGVSIAEYPDVVATGQMQDSTLPNANSFTCVSIQPRDSQSIVSQLKQKRKISASLTNTMSRLRDLESEAKLQSEDELLESLVVGQEKVFECQVSSFVSGLDQEYVAFQVEKLSDQYRSKGYQVYKEAISLYPIFKSCLPGGAIEGTRAQLLPTSCVQALLPLFEIDRGHTRDVLGFTDRLGAKVNIDPWDPSLPSYNGIVSGTSGSGKSFLSNVILKRLSDEPQMKIFIVEIGGSYRRLTQVKGGQYFSFDLSGANGFNPLCGLNLQDPSTLEAGCEIICTIVGDKKDGVSKLNRSIVLRELAELLREDSGQITLSKLMKRWFGSEEKFLSDASKILYGWTGDRPFGKLLDNEKILEPSAHWSCFDLKGLNDYPELQRVVMLSIVKRVWELVRSNNDKKVLLLDEVWALVQENSAFIGEAFRTFRKHNAAAIAVTQSIEDIATESLIAAVLNNAPTKIILKQSLKPERLQKLLDLNERELEIVGNLRSVKGEFSEFFMINGDKKRFLKLEPTSEDYWLSTTNPSDLDFLNHFLTKHPELTELQGCNEISKRYGRNRP